MALSLSTTVKDKVANLLYTTGTYATLGAGPRQSLIDAEGASALTELETYAQWFTFTAASGNAPNEWEPWFVTKIVARIQANAHPDQAPFWDKRDRDAMFRAFDSYSRNAINYSPASSEAFVFNTINNRVYVLGHCLRLKPSLMPTIESVDSALNEILTDVWNRGSWTFARRPVRIAFTRTAFTGGAWNNTTKTIMGLTGVAASVPVGTRFYLTAGTGVVVQDYAIASNTTTTLVLTSSIADSSGIVVDGTIAGFYVLPIYHGIGASEAFDSIATTTLVYTDASHEYEQLVWLSADDFAKSRASNATGTARPRYFRTHQPTSTGTIFLFSPPPDSDYTVMGEVIVKQAAPPSSTTDTATFASFAAEFMPALRRAQLDRVLTNYGRTNDALHRQVADEMDGRFPDYQDPGDPDTRVGVTDVYHDREDQRYGWSPLRGSEGAI